MAGFRQHQRMRFGWAVEAGVILVLASPILWGISAALDWPRAIELTFMWLTIALLAIVLASMVALPFITRSEDRAWGKFTPPPGVQYDATDWQALAPLQRFPMFPFDLFGPGEESASNVLRTSYDSVPVTTLTYVRREPNEPRSIQQVIYAQLPSPLPLLEIKAPLELRGAMPKGSRVQIEYDEFNRRYVIGTYDGTPAARKYAVDILNPRGVEGLLAHEPVDVTIAGRYAVSTSHFSGKPENALKLLDTYGRALAHLVSHIPAHVYADYGPGGVRPKDPA